MQETNIEKKLKEKISDLLDGLDVVIGYGKNSIAGRVNPVFVKDKSEIGNLIFDRFCINNLSVYPYYMTEEFQGNIGIVLKPCDAKSVVQLISEELLDRKKIISIVAGCSGVIDIKKILKHTGGRKIVSISQNSQNMDIGTTDENFSLNISDFYADKCYKCNIYDNPPYFDEFIENDEKLNINSKEDLKEGESELLTKLENTSFDEILAFWEKEFSRCIRCYACRNICPMEICRDKCIAQLDSPHWQSGKINAEEGKFFQLIRVMHLAGRCTECGECQRVCPANIPLLTLMKKVNKEILRLFDYTPGMDAQARPPLLTFKNVEKNIKEEELI